MILKKCATKKPTSDRARLIESARSFGDRLIVNGEASLVVESQRDQRRSVLPCQLRKTALRVFDAAARMKRAKVALFLGVPESTLRHWLTPSECDRSPSAAVLLELAVDRRFPEGARLSMLSVLLHGGGLEVVSAAESDPEQAPLPAQMLEVSEAIGHTSRRVLDALRSTGQLGSRVTRAEAARIVARAEEAQRELAEFVATARALASVHAEGEL